MKNFNIAIVGLGNIGMYLYRHLIKNKNNIKKKPMLILQLNMFLLKIKQKKEKQMFLK